MAGATSGGAALVVRNDSGIQKPEDFHGKKIASPQMGNTQDVALRAWLIAHGMKSTDKGGDVQVIPLANPDQLTLFLKKELDGAWAPEPWATRLIKEGNGRLFLDERTLWPNGQFIAAHLIVRTQFLKEHPDLVKNWIRAHVELTDWINGHLPEAKKLLNQQIAKETGKALPDAVLEEAFGRMMATYDPLRGSLMNAAKSAFDAGFLGREMPDLSSLYDLSLLNQVLSRKREEGNPMSTSPQNAYPVAVPVTPRKGVRANVFQGKPASSVTTLPPRAVAEVVVPKVALDADLAQLQNNRRASACWHSTTSPWK